LSLKSSLINSNSSYHSTLAEDQIEYSDDEKEAEARKMMKTKKKKKHPSATAASDNAEEPRDNSKKVSYLDISEE